MIKYKVVSSDKIPDKFINIINLTYGKMLKALCIDKREAPQIIFFEPTDEPDAPFRFEMPEGDLPPGYSKGMGGFSRVINIGGEDEYILGVNIEQEVFKIIETVAHELVHYVQYVDAGKPDGLEGNDIDSYFSSAREKHARFWVSKFVRRGKTHFTPDEIDETVKAIREDEFFSSERKEKMLKNWTLDTQTGNHSGE